MKHFPLILIVVLLLAGCRADYPTYLPDEIQPQVEKPEEPEDTTATTDTTGTTEPGDTTSTPVDPGNKPIETPVHFPEIRIATDYSAEIKDKVNYVSGSITFIDQDKIYSDVVTLTERMKIRGRGNSTWDQFPKKPYRIKMDESHKVFGMRSDKDWILLADYSDKTLLHNRFAMEISKVCEMPWTPEMRSVMVYLNNKCIGVYTLSEHKEVGKHKVDISENGVYLEIGEEMNEPVCFNTTMDIPIMFKDPENPSSEVQSRVKKQFNDFERALKNPENRVYLNFIDVNTFVNYFIVQELVKNPDGNLRRSSYMTLDKDNKLRMYHVWDFDLAFGNCDFFGSLYGIDASPSGWFVKEFNRYGRNRGWYWALFKDPAFKAQVKARWQSLYPALEELMEYPNEQAVFLANAQITNFECWPIMGAYVWPNAYVGGTYTSEIYHLWDFYYVRLRWMDSQISTW